MNERPNSGTVIVAGVPGVGKGALLARAEEDGLLVINFGNLMVELSGCDSRDEMRAKLSLPDQEVLQQTVWFAIGDIPHAGLVIVDTHVSIAQPGGTYMPGIPAGVPRIIDLRGLVLCEAQAADIARRSDADQTRDRGNRSVQTIAAHQVVNRRMGKELCSSLKIPLLKIRVQPEPDLKKRGRPEAKILIDWLGKLD